MNSPTGIGIVGCGIIADIHAAAIQEMNGGRLVSVFSRNAEKANQLGGKYGVRGYSDWELFIKNPDLELVVICTPNGTHLDYGKKVALAGRHVVVEKPIEVTVSRAQELIDLCALRNISLAVIYQNRYLPDVQKMHEIVQQGTLGKIIMASAYIKWFRTQEYYDADEWRGTFALEGGGVLINQAIHTIDLLQWIAGKIKTVMGYIRTATHQNIEGEDNAVAAFEFKTGAVGVLEASTSIIPAMARRIEIHGERGTAMLDGDILQILKEGESAISEKKAAATGASSPLAGFSTEPHRRQLEAIVHALQNNGQPPVSGRESLESLKIVRAIYRSAREKRPIEIEG